MILKRYSQKWSKNFTQKSIHKHYLKIVPQTLLKNWPQMLLKKWSTNVTQKVIHKRYSKVEPQALLKNWPSNVTQKWSTNVTQKLTQKRYLIVSNKHGIKKSLKTNTLSWLFFDWKIAATSYKNLRQLYET